MSKLKAWLHTQRKIVELDATHAERIALEGPDEKLWGRWPVGLDELEGAIDAAIQALGDELPAGRHTCRLLALDVSGQQTSMFPRTIVGKSAGAATAATDNKAMQQAVAQAVRNNEEQTLGLRNENDRLRERLAQELTEKFELADKLQAIAYANVDLQLRREESEARQKMWAQMVDKMGPGLEVLGGALAEKGLALFAAWEEEYTERVKRTAEARAATKRAEDEAREAPQVTGQPEPKALPTNGKSKKRGKSDVRQPIDEGAPNGTDGTK